MQRAVGQGPVRDGQAGIVRSNQGPGDEKQKSAAGRENGVSVHGLVVRGVHLAFEPDGAVPEPAPGMGPSCCGLLASLCSLRQGRKKNLSTENTGITQRLYLSRPRLRP